MENTWGALLALALAAAFLILSRGVKRLCQSYLKRRKGHDDQQTADRHGQRE